MFLCVQVRLYLPGLGTGLDDEDDKQCRNGKSSAQSGSESPCPPFRAPRVVTVSARHMHSALAAGETALRTRKKLERMQQVATTAEEPSAGQPIVVMVVEDILKEDQDDDDGQDESGGRAGACRRG